MNRPTPLRSDSPPRASSARRVVSRRLLAVLLLVTLILAACFALALRRADAAIAAQQLADAEHHFSARIQAIEQGWLTQADSFRGQLEFNRILEGGSRELRQERFVAYVASFGGEALFTHFSVVDLHGRELYAYRTRTAQRLPLPPASDQPLSWVYGKTDDMLYRAISQPIQVADGPARLLLYVPLDNALLEANAYPGTRLRVAWQGRALAASQSLPALVRNTTLVEGGVPWGPEASAPILQIERRVTLPFALDDLMLALLAAVTLIMLAGWMTLGRWFDVLAQRVALLNAASQRFSALAGAAQAPPGELDRVAAAGRDELAQLAVGLREMMARVIDARMAQDRASADLTRTLDALRVASDASEAALGHLEATLEALPDLLLEIDSEGRVLDARLPPGMELPGLATVSESPPRLADFLPPRAVEGVLRALQGASQARSATPTAPIEVLLEAGDRERCFELTAARMNRSGAGQGNFIVLARDISARKEAEARIEHLAYYDTLTGLPNRRLLLDRLQHALATAARHGGFGALMFIDLDNFKLLNDTRGHHFGDQLLCEAGARLAAAVRAGDSVARLGGDEFVVLVESLGRTETQAQTRAGVVGAQLLSVLNEPYILQDRPYHLSASIGVSLFRGDGDNPEEVLKRSDAAMYRAKDAGRNAIRFYDPEAEVAFEARLRLESELRRALPEGGFLLHYQPQFSTTGAVVGAEALLRWQHPTRGLLLPMDFIPVAEATGLIVPIGAWVLDAACRQLCDWDAAGMIPEDFRMAVNVSARQFSSPEFLAQVRGALSRYGIAPRRLTLELTESLVMENVNRAVVIMEELRALGVGFSVDDFGTGYSSLAYLRLLPLDELKIDKSFVQDYATERGAAIVQTIIGMAQGLGLAVVAEGVETPAQLEFLSARGCGLFQGWLLGAAVPAELFGQPARSAGSGMAVLPGLR